MAEIIRMPKMSDTMTEGVIAEWHKKVGDTIKSGDVVAEVETDKATMELDAYESGTLLYIGVEKGKAAPVDGILYIIGKPNEDYQSLLDGENATKTEPKTDVKTDVKPTEKVAEKIAEKPAENASASVSATATQSSVSVDTSSIKARIERMPKMSDTMTEGVIVAWLKKVGDSVKAGDILAEIETDKAVMELEAYESGTLLYLGIEAGGSVPVDAILYVIGDKNADYKALLNAQNGVNAVTNNAVANNVVTPIQSNENPLISPPSSESSNESLNESSNESSSDERLKISPLARKMAKDLGYNINQIKGSGDGGRIVKADIEQFNPLAEPAKIATKTEAKSNETELKIAENVAKTSVSPTSVSQGNNFIGESFEEVAVSQMRKTIARRLGESLFTAPHFYLTMEINMDNAMLARTRLNEISPVKLSFNDLVIKATAMALKLHPKVNSSWLGDKIRYNNHVHIGVAIAVEDGLLVPVVRFADMKGLAAISAEVKEMGAKAKNKLLQPKDWEGNTFTISNLGMFGIDEFTAIINSPDACILAVGGIKETAIVKNGALAVGNIMKVTLSCDHRVVDGATGSAFLQALKANLEEPMRMLV